MTVSRGSVCCVGLGFVGLHTTLEFIDAGYDVVGFDIDPEVIKLLESGESPINGAGFDERVSVAIKNKLTVSTDIAATTNCSAYLLSVPTPLTDGNIDISAVREAAASVAEVLSEDDLVVVQSSVYPGCTRDTIIPELERSGLVSNSDFGISCVPERYSPGDDIKREPVRVVGSVSPEWHEVTTQLYGDIVDTLHAAPSIEAAEAAKLTENTQRAVNIALMNELSKIYNAIGVDTEAVLNAANTKWNFHDYFPGLGVGGHCLPVDPWYLTETARKCGATPALIESACRTNDYMPHYHFSRLTQALEDAGRPLREATVAIFGATYKPGVYDLRNSPALRLANLLFASGTDVQIYDPMFAADEKINIDNQKTIRNAESPQAALENADAVVIGTPSDEFKGVLDDINEIITLNPWPGLNDSKSNQ